MSEEKSHEKSLQELQAARPEECLQTAIMFWERDNPECRRWIELGFKLAQPNGWMFIAPAWLREYREKQSDKNIGGEE